MNERVVLAYQAVIDEQKARIAALEAAARLIVDTSDARQEHLLAGLRDATCWACDHWPDAHADDCPVVVLRALLEEA